MSDIPQASGIPISQGGYSFVPVPDPTILTTHQLHREISGLREILEARLRGMDMATELVATDVNRVPTNIDKLGHNLTDLFNERLAGLRAEVAGIDRANRLQFEERDQRRRAAEEASAKAVSAALQSVREAADILNQSNAAAINKSETSMVKQIDGLMALIASAAATSTDKIGTVMALITTATQTTNDKLAALSSRVDRNEAMVTGAQENRNENRAGNGSNVALVGVCIAAIAVVVSLFSIFAVQHSSSSASVPQVIYQQPQPHG